MELFSMTLGDHNYAKPPHVPHFESCSYVRSGRR